MSRFVNILVSKAKLSRKDREAIRDFIASNPECWGKEKQEAIDDDWKNAEREYLLLDERVGANQGYEDVPYLKLDKDDPLATEYAYIKPGPDKPITQADKIRKVMEELFQKYLNEFYNPEKARQIAHKIPPGDIHKELLQLLECLK